MTKLINIRGTNGSGKSTLVRKVMTEFQVVPYYSNPKTSKAEVLGYVTPNGKVAVIGKYTTDCGGCDTIKNQQEIKNRIDLMAKNLRPKVILFEGVVVSTIYQPWYDFAATYGGMTWAYLDTPLEVCLQRINERNGGKEINVSLVEDKIKSILSTRRKAEAAGATVVTLPWQDPYPKLLETMND